MAAQAEISESIHESSLGKTLTALVEANPDPGIFIGRTRFQAPEVEGITFIYGKNIDIGTFVRVKITETHAYDLVGELV